MHQTAGKIHQNSWDHVNGEAPQGERAKEERDEREKAGERDREIMRKILGFVNSGKVEFGEGFHVCLCMYAPCNRL